jgi:hypothetical protein
MRTRSESERTRAALGLGALIGIPVALLSSAVLLPTLGYPQALIPMAAVAGVPTLLLLRPRIGTGRAITLAVVVAIVAAVAFVVVGFAACAATGCVG